MPQLWPVYAIIGFLICGIYTVLQDRENAIITIMVHLFQHVAGICILLKPFLK